MRQCFFIVKAGSYPLGVWVNDWAAGHLVAEMMTILMEEMGPKGMGEVEFFASLHKGLL